VTYSIVAADTARREVGGAGTSCLEGSDVHVIYGAVPGRGVVHAQAYYNAEARRRATELLESELAPAEILARITQASFDSSSNIRQYGMVNVRGQSAGFTGDGTTPFASDRQGALPGFAYSVQGNILTSEKVLTQAARGFESSGCDLAERLMSALEAGALGGEGDSRCTGDGIPSDSAFLQVESPDQPVGGYLALRVPSSGPADPLPLLRAKLEAWRAEHPCPVSSAPNQVEAGEGCGCRVAASSNDAVGLLLCGLLVVAWRERSSRKVRPALASRHEPCPSVPSPHEAELRAHEIHAG
jgi:uncharacterized Ntn-hydrolase superfamily protein